MTQKVTVDFHPYTFTHDLLAVTNDLENRSLGDLENRPTTAGKDYSAWFVERNIFFTNSH